MKYKTLAAAIATATDSTPKRVRTFFIKVAEILVATLEEGDHVRTPMGTFRMTRRQPFSVQSIQDGDWVAVSEELVVKLKPGRALRRDPEDQADPDSGDSDTIISSTAASTPAS